ncbi:MAG: hypothetical protein N2045_13960 [Fimbriimonadales bacterium]|nr:hypothetical protein [Fimbriimonadales bacterium]
MICPTVKRLAQAVQAALPRLPSCAPLREDLPLRVLLQAHLCRLPNRNGAYRQTRVVEYPLRKENNPLRYFYAFVDGLRYLPDWDEFYEVYLLLSPLVQDWRRRGLFTETFADGLKARLYRCVLGYFTELHASLLLVENLPDGQLWRGLDLDRASLDALWERPHERIGIRIYVRTERACAYREHKDRHPIRIRVERLADLTYSPWPGEHDSLTLLPNGLGYVSREYLRKWLADLSSNDLRPITSSHLRSTTPLP